MSHEHERYAPIPMNKFTRPEGFRERVQRAIVKVKRNKAVGAYGIHIEMLKADPATCVESLTS